MEPVSDQTLIQWLINTEQRTSELLADLSAEQMACPYLPILNPILWEIGHVAWFHERWILRHCLGREMLHPYADDLYDSAGVKHETRWGLTLLSRDDTFKYYHAVHDHIRDAFASRELTPDLRYFAQLSLFHEDMHAEALTYTRQTLSLSAPRISDLIALAPPSEGPLSGDAEVPGQTYLLGASRERPFVFDNEQWEHPVRVGPFAIARAPVTQSEMLAFVKDGGYQRQELWGRQGLRWRQRENATHPVYWRQESSGDWSRRAFDQWHPLEPHRPMIHVNLYEAEAYCRWAKRRLPTEAEWELASRGLEVSRFAPECANFDSNSMGMWDVGAAAGSESDFGCRQMLGNVWEWTSTPFEPYPDFEIGPYREYSKPWFRTHTILRGGGWATRSRLMRRTYRNYYLPQRRDIFAGFRTCALDD